MLRSCLPYLGSPNCVDKDSRRTVQLEGASNSSLSFDSTFNSKHIFVRVVHAGGKVEHYPSAVLASKLLENLPGKWLARPEVFKHPHDSLVCPEEYLLPGHKYYVIPLSTIDKLKRKHNKMMAVTAKQVEGRSEESFDRSSSAVEITGEEYCMDESFSSAKDFYVSKEKWSRSCLRSRNGSKGAQLSRRSSRILLPLPKPKPCSGYTWEPGLTSIQEVSP